MFRHTKTRVVIIQQHNLNNELVREINKSAAKFNAKNYSKIENIDNMLLKRDISVEKKKGILLKKLHESIVKAFSVNRKKLNKKAFESLKKRMHIIRKIIGKLRSINYYLETSFLEDLKLSKIKIADKIPRLRQEASLARDELEALEYTAYRLIGEAVMLDKKLLKEYSAREKKAATKGKIEMKDTSLILKKESLLLEHLEAKLPPPKAATMDMVREPLFTHWVARVFALLSHLDNLHSREKAIFAELKKDKSLRRKIENKIMIIIAEKSKLLRIMEEKAVSMKKFNIDNKFKREFHNLATAINL